MSIWLKIRRWLGFPAFEYDVWVDTFVVADFYMNVTDYMAREDFTEWADENCGRKNWRIDFHAEPTEFKYDPYNPKILVQFRYSKHAMLFKMSW